ncbi:hypothetical protein SmJEL517_g04332 [Synchytrium microbalum]|uniref:Peptidase C14 caspase domain-containing protein n=1 Tax=Synchytrium microbalum TaxID=1806994 RepID=A0A507C3V5_9FUNG|nr:uncharacterized protein SmJEL517_g04332 [Synchytrium microbalum]TPX32646.1 hypothetical protein SmJEL517_g04332 [Synchytrium microbalum]
METNKTVLPSKYRAQQPQIPPPQGYVVQQQQPYFPPPNTQYQYGQQPMYSQPQNPPPPAGYGGYAPPANPPPPVGYGGYAAPSVPPTQAPYQQPQQPPQQSIYPAPPPPYNAVPPPAGYYQPSTPQPQGPPPGFVVEQYGQPSPQNQYLPPPGQTSVQQGWAAPAGVLQSYRLSNLTGKKKALLVGCNYFGQRSQLSGCINDVRNMSKFIIMNYGFKNEPGSMLFLTDDQADPNYKPTRANIINACKWLVGGAAPGDSLFFHYSGHGGTAVDPTGDQASADTILPLDHAQAGEILDNDLHALMVKHLPPGVRLTAIFDSCHSGTALNLPFTYLPDGTLKKHNPLNQLGKVGVQAAQGFLLGDIGSMINAVNGVMTAVNGLGTNSEQKLAQQQALNGSYADVIMFAGCKDSQTSADTSVAGVGATGAMSYAFIAALTQNRNQSFAQLLGSVRGILAAKYSQTPQLSSGRYIDMNQLFAC